MTADPPRARMDVSDADAQRAVSQPLSGDALTRREWDRAVERLAEHLAATTRKVILAGREPGVESAAQIVKTLADAMPNMMLHDLVRLGAQHDLLTRLEGDDA